MFRCVWNICFLCTYSLYSCVLCHIVAVLMFYSVLFLYLTTHSFLKPTYVKHCKLFSWTNCCFGNQFCALSHFIGSTYNEILYRSKGIVVLLWGGIIIVCTLCFNMLHYINSFSNPAALFCSSLHFRRHFILHFTFCC